MQALIPILLAPVMVVLTIYYVLRMVITDVAHFSGWLVGTAVRKLLFSAKWIDKLYKYKVI